MLVPGAPEFCHVNVFAAGRDRPGEADRELRGVEGGHAALRRHELDGGTHGLAVERDLDAVDRRGTMPATCASRSGVRCSIGRNLGSMRAPSPNPGGRCSRSTIASMRRRRPAKRTETRIEPSS
jgi:hypothetical protein